MRHRLEYFLFQLVKWSVLLLPLKSAQRLGYYIGSAAFRLAKARRNVALDNLLHAFPEKSQAERASIAKEAFTNYAISLVELLWFPNLNDEIIRKLVKPLNLDMLERAFEKGRGMVLLSGHFGNWELIAFSIAYLFRQPLSIIVQTQNNKYVDEVINRHRCLLGNRVIPMGMSVREIIKTLNSGGIVAIAPDQSGPREGPFVNFFGRSVATHQGPAAFALRCAAPMLMGFIFRQKDGTYEVTLEEVPSADLAGEEGENVLELTRRHTALLERYIRKYPGHWLWMHRRWKHTFESLQNEKQPSPSL